jgi:Zn-dependent peptidase ImmA (M78 family)
MRLPAIKLRRGFVAEANRWALDFRAELGLAAQDPLCSWKLAKHLCVPVFRLSQLRECKEREILLEKRDGHDFSGAVCFDGRAAFIVINDAHDAKRQVSDIAHELAHVLLGHPPSNPFQDDGVREFSAEHEAEAERLGPALLISDAAAWHARRLIVNGHHLTNLSDAWGISKEVIQMRINLSGAGRRIPQAA